MSTYYQDPVTGKIVLVESFEGETVLKGNGWVNIGPTLPPGKTATFTVIDARTAGEAINAISATKTPNQADYTGETPAQRDAVFNSASNPQTPRAMDTPAEYWSRYLAQMNAATSYAALDDIKKEFDALYTSGDMNSGTYNNLYQVFQQRAEVLQAPGSTPPPVSTPPPGSVGGTGGTGDTNWEGSELPAYMKQFGLGAAGQNPWQKWLMGQYTPTFGTYQARNIMNQAAQGQQAMSWTDYLSQLGGNLMGTRTQARDLFEQARTQPTAGQNNFVDDMGDSLDDLLRNVLRQAYGYTVANNMSSRIPMLQQQYTSQQGPGAPVGGFLDWFKQQVGLR